MGEYIHVQVNRTLTFYSSNIPAHLETRVRGWLDVLFYTDMSSFWDVKKIFKTVHFGLQD